MPTKTLNTRLTKLSPQDLFLITLWGEARGEPIEGQVAVAHVIQNRVISGRWGETHHDVLGRWAQFSALWPQLSGGLNYQEVLDLAGVLDRGEVLGGMQTYLVQQLRWVVTGVMEHQLLDNTYGSTHYFAPHIVKPSWATSPGVRMAKYGRHEFWAGVP